MDIELPSVSYFIPMEELHWIAARARALACMESACGHRLARTFYTWRSATVILAAIEAAAVLRAESDSLASLLANARVRILELSEPLPRVLWV